MDGADNISDVAITLFNLESLGFKLPTPINGEYFGMAVVDKEPMIDAPDITGILTDFTPVDEGTDKSMLNFPPT